MIFNYKSSDPLQLSNDIEMSRELDYLKINYFCLDRHHKKIYFKLKEYLEELQ